MGSDDMPPLEMLLDDFAFDVPFDHVITPGYEFPRTSQASVGWSQQLTPNLALDVDYVHSHTTHAGKVSDLNEMRVPFDRTSRLFWPDNRAELIIVESIGERQCDGLQVSLRKRFSNRTQYVINYTLSRLSGYATGLGITWRNRAECRACIGDERETQGRLPVTPPTGW